MAKVGEEIDRLTKEYIEIYNRLKADGFEKADSIAVADLILSKFTYEEALKNVQAYIERDKEQDPFDLGLTRE